MQSYFNKSDLLIFILFNKMAPNKIKKLSLQSDYQMVVVAQLVRASVCGTEGRGFEPHHPPKWGFS